MLEQFIWVILSTISYRKQLENIIEGNNNYTTTNKQRNT